MTRLAATAIDPSVTPMTVPSYRYTSPEFAALEQARLWPSVWQVACTVDHVPAPGDFYEYRCGYLSVIIVRGEDHRLRAYQNVCRHRGNSLCQGSGSGITELRCPYHRWAWDLEGHLREVPSRKGFGPGMRFEEFGLFPVQVDTWGPLVFVNLSSGTSADSDSLGSWLEGIPDDTSWAALDEFHCHYATVTPVAANWKVIAEGFSETYHVQGIHREMLASIDDVHAPQRLWERHGVSYQPYGVPSPRLGREVGDDEVWASFFVTQGGRMGPDAPSSAPPVPPGETVRDVIAESIRRHQATRGVDLSGLDTDRILRLSQYNLFPNTTVLVWGEMVNVLVALPGITPEDAFFVSYTCYRAAPGSTPSRATDMHIPTGTAALGLVMGQDFELMRTAQLGLHQPGLTSLAISSEECRIINLHRNLERQLGIDPSEMHPIGSDL